MQISPGLFSQAGKIVFKGAGMEELFELTKFDSYKEDNRKEVKKAESGLPNSLWDT